METNEPVWPLDPEAPQRTPHDYLLRLVTSSFCRELVEYGARERDVVNVSSYVLDFILRKNDRQQRLSGASPARFRLEDVRRDDAQADVHGEVHGSPCYALGEVALRPWTDANVPRAAAWLARRDVQESFVEPYPTDERDLRDYMRESDQRSYRVIAYGDEPVGLIGAEHIDSAARKVEMRKLVGEPAYRGLGIGTKATFLFLHHAFDVAGFNKVFIHTLDTNLRNINLNRSLGFDLEGIFYQEVFVGGRLRDVLRMSLLQEAWAQRVR